ncbi:heavy metal translocating P-type ATPase [Candidatus Poriferisodalis sp.]|uniref:heavy metal translocating P-type ATPase n=1 Tax=Candidatus Poriferisodalis sp. TaxID=3101277 RepID=UPI003B02D623
MTARSEFAVGGMTCAACASRIRSRLDELDAVAQAQVNFATRRATVVHDGSLDMAGLAAEVAALGYSAVAEGDAEAAERRRLRELSVRLTVAAVLTLPVVVVSMLSPLQFRAWQWPAAMLASGVIVGAGWPFHRAAGANLRQRSVTMDTLVSLGSLSALAWSAAVTVAGVGDGHVYFETGAVIVTLILLGKWLELRATRRAGDAIRSLAALGARTARLVDGREIPIADLAIGMRFVVRPGDRISTDGVVIDGRSAVDASMVTGEETPVEVGPGDEVIGATVNAHGVLVVEATSVGADTVLAQIIRLVSQAQDGRGEVQRLADRVSAVFVPVAMAVAIVTLATWLLLGEAGGAAVSAAVAVLIVACPCALGLATPLAILVGTGRGAQLGVIIKGGDVLEDTRSIDVVLLDKTGTVTEGAMTLADVRAGTLPSAERDEVHRLAAAAETLSSHPIAVAIAGSVDRPPDARDIKFTPGVGVTASVGGVEIRVGRRSLFHDVAASVEALAADAEASGATAVLAGRGGSAEIVLVVADRVRPTSAAAVAALQAQGLQVTLLTGDNRRTAHRVAAEVGIDSAIAEVYPDDKAAAVKELQAAGKRVAMVGDGLNDAPALAQADLGIAVGTGADVAVEASDLTVVSGDLRGVVDAIGLARRTLATIRGNLFWAFVYNAAAIPLAAFGVLNPMVAAGAMGASSLFVVTNSLRLRRFRGSRHLPVLTSPSPQPASWTSRPELTLGRTYTGHGSPPEHRSAEPGSSAQGSPVRERPVLDSPILDSPVPNSKEQQ